LSTVVVADHDPERLESSRLALASAGHTVVVASSGESALEALAGCEVDVVLTSVALPGMTGIELCAHVGEQREDIPVIVTTGDAKLETAIAAIRAGAFDYVLQPTKAASLLVAVARAVRRRSLRRQIRLVRRGAIGGAPSHHLLGHSDPMRKVFDLVERLADSEAIVLVLGASGTGKDLVAEALHQRSRRHGAPLVTFDCAALPEAALEGELFGEGRELDGKSSPGGAFSRAQGGTLVLDEIGALPLSLQAKLIRALQDRRVLPVGSSVEVPVDVRVIAASSKNLEAAVEERRFRADLFFRINVVQIVLPPLRTRGGDILLLAEHFLGRFALRAGKEVHGIGPDAAARLLAYDWPGNVRELQSAIERAVALTTHDELGPGDLPENVIIQVAAPPLVSEDLTGLLSLREVTRRHIARVLALTGYNKTIAARVLGIDRKTLYRRLEADDLADSTRGDPR
jgi:DNA-binding NtrC family response regulator